jgi:riboflavin biosynthesis pyrimidine reductase
MTERQIRIDGDRWKVKLSRTRSGPGLQALVFFPVTCDQRPYRVVEVSEERVGGEDALDRLSERELRELYLEGGSMGHPRSYA